MNYSTTGLGTGSHLFMEMLQQAAGMKVTVVPYKGSAQQITDLMGGQIELVLDYSVVVTPADQGRQAHSDRRHRTQAD